MRKDPTEHVASYRNMGNGTGPPPLTNLEIVSWNFHSWFGSKFLSLILQESETRLLLLNFKICHKIAILSSFFLSWALSWVNSSHMDFWVSPNSAFGDVSRQQSHSSTTKRLNQSSDSILSRNELSNLHAIVKTNLKTSISYTIKTLPGESVDISRTTFSKRLSRSWSIK